MSGEDGKAAREWFDRNMSTMYDKPIECFLAGIEHERKRLLGDSKPDGWVVEFPDGSRMNNGDGEDFLYRDIDRAITDKLQQQNAFANEPKVRAVKLVVLDEKDE